MSSAALQVTDQDREGGAGKISQSDKRKAEKKQKRRKGSKQLAAPDPQAQVQPTATPGTINTGKGSAPAGQGASGGGKSALNIKK